MALGAQAKGRLPSRVASAGRSLKFLAPLHFARQGERVCAHMLIRA